MMNENERWQMYGLQAIERVNARRMVWSEFAAAMRVLKLAVDRDVLEHLQQLEKYPDSTFVDSLMGLHQNTIFMVTPIFKANESNLFENYRPISVLTCFSKLLEKLMYKRLYNYVEKQKILTKHQYGFRRNRSTEHAILEPIKFQMQWMKENTQWVFSLTFPKLLIQSTLKFFLKSYNIMESGGFVLNGLRTICMDELKL